MDNKGVEIVPERILIIKLSALGDVVQALPVLSALKDTWHSCQIDWITGEVGAGLLHGHPLIRRLIVYQRNRLGRLAANPVKWPLLAQELYGLRHYLREGRYDMALDLQGLFKSGLITWLSGARQRVGYAGGREASSLFLNRKLPKYDPDRHAVLRYLDVARYLGAEVDKIRFPLGLSAQDMEQAKSFIHQMGLEPNEFIIIVPGTIWPTKHWTIEGFSRVADLIFQRTGLKSLIAGSGADTPLASQIEAGSHGGAIDITGKTSLKLFAALSSLATAGITTDTGPMHLAAAAGLRVVALFGPTAPWRTGPFGRGHIVLRKGLECSPCFKRQCTKVDCMKAISPQEVVESVERLLASRQSHN